MRDDARVRMWCADGRVRVNERRCFVKIYDVDFDEEVEYQIIGSTESDPSKGLISNESPVGQALLGKKVGDSVEVTIPETGATLKFKVLAIRV